MLRLKLWRMGRVIIDSGLHTGAMTWDEAVEVESERIGFVRRGGQINIDGISTGGSGTAAPTLGYFEWMLLREDYFKKMRELDQKGTLKDFHDRVYKIGFLPVTLVRDELLHQLEPQFRRRVRRHRRNRRSPGRSQFLVKAGHDVEVLAKARHYVLSCDVIVRSVRLEPDRAATNHAIAN